MSKRKINLLTKSEISDLYDLPELNETEQSLYFSLSKQEEQLANKFTTTNTKLYFILQLGYFKAKPQFFKFRFEDIKSDVEYVFTKYCGGDCPLKGSISRERIESQKKIILKHFDYKVCSGNILIDLQKQFSMLISSHPKPHNAIRELLKYCEDRNIILPAYRKFQDLYSEVYKNELARVSEFLNQMPDNIKGQLSDLINDDGENTLSLNDLRYDQQDFSYTAIMNEVNKVNILNNLYRFCKSTLPSLELSQNAIRYYSEITEQYPVAKLRKMSLLQQYLHALCFIYHRYQVFVDNLITSFIHHAKIIKNDEKENTEKGFANHAIKIIKEHPSLATFFRWFPKQEQTELSHDHFYKEAYKILPKDDFEKVADYFEGSSFDMKAAKWKFYEGSSRSIALYLRPIILALDLKYYKPDNLVIPLIKVLKDHYSKGKTPSQLKFVDDLGLNLPLGIIQYLKTNQNDDHLNPYRLEFYVYDKIRCHLNRGRMFCNDSIGSKDIDCDLVPDELVDKAGEISKKYGYTKIPIYCDQRLDDLLLELDETWDLVTENIKSGRNNGIKITHLDNGETKWQLTYDASSKLDDSFFRKIKKIGIADIFTFIDNKTNAFDGFEHIKGRYIKRTKPAALAIIACILSEAFGFGIKEMAEMSDINFNSLRSTKEDFVRVETLDNVSTFIADFIKGLPIFKAWNLLDDKLLADLDGQKESTAINTIQSRYSKKYLGKGTGLSVLSLIANFIAVNVKNIGLNEYEGHHLYDMIYGNKTGVQIDAVTGDGHITNKLNHVALDAIDVEFLPSVKNVRSEAEKLYSVKEPSEYSGLITPFGKINKKRIKKYKRGVTRILLSLILQENTQSILIRKLNSHSRYAGLRAALYEYNKIFNSIHVLKLIDDMQLRKALRTARNRTESYHQLQKLIRNMYHGVFRGRRISSNQVSTQAVRLVSNIVTAYNAVILDQLYQKLLARNASDAEIKRLLRISPMSWIHIAFTGRYTFNGEEIEIDLTMIIKALEKELKNIEKKAREKAA